MVAPAQEDWQLTQEELMCWGAAADGPLPLCRFPGSMPLPGAY